MLVIQMHYSNNSQLKVVLYKRNHHEIFHSASVIMGDALLIISLKPHA